MYKKPCCQNPSCLYHQNPDSSMIIKKGQDKRKNKTVQRYQCKACGQQFTSSALQPETFHKPELLQEIFLRYTSGYSVSRLSEELEISKNTTLTMIKFLADKTKTYHHELLASGFLNTDKVYFDEMESFVHSKVYPVSIGLAVDVRYKRIIDIQIAEIKVKGRLKKKLMEQEGGMPIKIENRPNNSPQMLIRLMGSIRKAISPNGHLYSDEKTTYPALVRATLPAGIVFTQELSKVDWKVSVDKQGLGRFRSTCAYLRTYLGTMGRRKLNTAKSMDSLSDHLYLMIARYNKYDLKEIINFKNDEGFFENEWTKRKQMRDLKILIAIITYPNFLRKYARIEKLRETWKKKKEAQTKAS